MAFRLATRPWGGSRPDVASASGNSTWTNAGWSLNLSAANLTVGTHTVTAVATDLENLSSTFKAATITVIAGTKPPIGYVDQAVDSVGGTSTVSQADNLVVSGWAADYNDNGPAQSVTIYVDGAVTGTATLGYLRSDVAAAYGTSAWSKTGWFASINAAGISAGSHTVTAIATDLENVSTTLNARTITVTDGGQRAPVGNFDHARDSVTQSQTIPQSDTLSMAGWAADYNDNGPVQSVAIYIDGVLMGDAILGRSRPDVASASGNNAWTNVGWSLDLSAANLNVGSHTVTAVATDLENISTTFAAPIINVTTGQ